MKVKNRQYLAGFMLFITAGAAIVFLGRADTVGDAQIPYTSVTDQDSYFWTGNTPDGWKWTTSPWTGDDAPYSEVRSNIERLIAGGQDPKNVYTTYREAALRNTQDPVAQFGYAYAAWKVRESLDGEMHMDGVLANALETLENMHSPLTYQVVRLRFLIESELNGMRELLPVSQTLLKRDASDLDVRYAYVGLLVQFAQTSEQRSQVLPLIRQLISSNPSMAYPHRLLGDYYSNACFASNVFTPEYVNDAINAFNRYIQLSPKGYYEVPLVAGMIKGLQTIKANGYKLPKSNHAGG
jgi:hypothetical protein